MVSPSKMIPKNIKSRNDRISNLPEVLIDKTLQLLPLNEAAKMSVLSKQWRTNWCCLSRLVFDDDFRYRLKNNHGEVDGETYISIVDNIFLHHQGPIHEFYLDAPDIEGDEYYGSIKSLNLKPWLSFLSRNGVKKITIENNQEMPDTDVPLPSHIYSCIELEELILTRDIILKPPPADFKGFKHIRKLELTFILLKGDILSSLIANCPKLTVLILNNLSNLNNLVIDAPKLESMSLSVSSVGFLKLKNVPNLAKFELELFCDSKSTTTDRETTEIIADAIKHLSASCELKSLHLSTLSSKVFVAIQKKISLPWALTHLHELSLGLLLISDDFSIFSSTFDFLRRCPSIKKFTIDVGRLRRRRNQNVEVEHNYDFENNFKLGNLVEVDISGVIGSNAELKFIKYVLSSSIVLRKLTIKVREIDDVVELKLQRELNAFQRASPKAQIIVS